MRILLGIREVNYFIDVELSFTSDFMIIGCFWSGSDYCFVRGRDEGIGSCLWWHKLPSSMIGFLCNVFEFISGRNEPFCGDLMGYESHYELLLLDELLELLLDSLLLPPSFI